MFSCIILLAKCIWCSNSGFWIINTKFCKKESYFFLHILNIPPTHLKLGDISSYKIIIIIHFKVQFGCSDLKTAITIVQKELKKTHN